MAGAIDAALEALRAEGALAGVRLGEGQRIAERIKGHASTRRFYRLQGGGEAARILVVYPAAAAAAEVQRYLSVTAWLQGAGVRVPRIHAHGERSLLVEDGGRDLLDSAPADPGRRLRCYRQAARIMVAIQRHGDRQAAPNGDWRLDAVRLRNELDFAEQHAVQGWQGLHSGARGRAEWFDRLARIVAALPRAVCHRDFHTRNLLVADDRLMVVDYQDLMVGPLFYDAASLIWDNYCDVDARLASATLATFWKARRRPLAVSTEAAVPEFPRGLPAAARQAFCLTGLQRSIKALGTFGYQVAVAGNTGFAPYVPRTFAYVARAARGLGWEALLELLPTFDASSA